LLRALALTPNNQYARVQLARTFLQAQAPDRALAVLREIRERSGPGELNEYAQIDLADLEARALLGQDKPDQAVALLDGVAKRYPEQPAAFEVISQLYLSVATVNPDFVTRAEEAVKRHLALSPTNLIARYNSGTVSFLKQDWAGAVASYSAVLQQDPGMQNARMNRAIANLRAGNYPPALEDYQKLAEKNPDLFQVQYGLGHIADKQGRTADALKHLNRYLELAPKGLPEYTNVLGQVAQLKGR
jgi:tetratricopeptide (TPR) repeat protein